MAIIEIIGATLVSQMRYMSDSEYLEKFRTKLSVLELAGGELTTHQGMVEDELPAGVTMVTATAAQLTAATSRAQGRFEAALFLAKSNQDKYG